MFEDTHLSLVEREKISHEPRPSFSVSLHNYFYHGHAQRSQRVRPFFGHEQTTRHPMPWPHISLELACEVFLSDMRFLSNPCRASLLRTSAARSTSCKNASSERMKPCSKTEECKFRINNLPMLKYFLFLTQDSKQTDEIDWGRLG
jgi:hypothetical protein